MGSLFGGGGGSSSSSNAASNVNVTTNVQVNPEFQIDTKPVSDALDALQKSLAGIGDSAQQGFNSLGQATVANAAVNLKIAEEQQATVAAVVGKVQNFAWVAAVGAVYIFFFRRK